MKTFRILLAALILAAAPMARAITGSGTAADPYVIADAADYATFADTSNASTYWKGGVHVRMDDNVSNVTAKVGTESTPFRGVFDGDGHTLHVALESADPCCAPFSWVYGATIRNLRTAGTVTLTSANANHASGLVGASDNLGVTLERCRSSVAITFPADAVYVHSGGFIGHAMYSSFTITDCVFDGSIGGSENLRNVGGLVGWDDNSNPFVSNCLNAGTFSNPSIIARIARVEGRGMITNCYSTVDATSSGDKSDDRGTYTTATGTELRDLLGPAWMVDSDGAVVPVHITPPHDGSAYVLSTVEDWDAFAASVLAGKRYVGQTVRLAADLSPVTTTVGIATDPSGRAPLGPSFSGVFDGAGHTLDLAITNIDYQGVAPFCHIDGATIQNVRVTGTLAATLHCGGIVGFAEGANLIAQCEMAAAVSCGGRWRSHCGGILGHGKTSSTTIRNCLFSGSFTGVGEVLGVIYGWGDNGTHAIESCLAAGTYDGCAGVDLLRKYSGTEIIVNCYRRTEGGEQGQDARDMTDDALLSALGDGWEIRDGRIVPVVCPTAVVVDLAKLRGDRVLVDGEVATGTLGGKYKVSVADGATVALRKAKIDGLALGSGAWAGLTCLGDATIVLEGKNVLQGFDDDHPGLQAGPTNTTLTIRGSGLLEAFSGGYVVGAGGGNAAGIGGGYHVDCGDIAIRGGTVTAYGGDHASGIGCKGTVHIGGGSVDAYGGNGGSGIGLGCASVVIAGGTVRATGGHGAAGIGGGTGGLSCGPVTIGPDIIRVTVTCSDENGCQPIGEGCGGPCGTVAVAPGLRDTTEGYTRVIEGPVFSGSGTNVDPYRIGTAAQWDALGALVAFDAKMAAKRYLLVSNIVVTTTIGDSGHPFSGVFDGAGHTLVLDIDDTANQGTAPFRYIDGATILNVRTAGEVAGTMHCSGLVGFARGTNLVAQCEVAASVVCGGSAHTHCGGILGHGKDSSTTLRNCLFSGSISGTVAGTGAATGILYGWGDGGGTHALENCLAAGTYDGCVNVGLLRKGGGTEIIVKCYLRTKVGEQGFDASGMSDAELLAALGPGWEIRDRRIVPVVLGARGVDYFDDWAAENRLADAWNAKDAFGVPNVFRYAFDVPKGPVTNPPLLSISFDANGLPVIETPPLANGGGFNLSILATDDLDGTGATDYPLNASGRTEIPASASGARFFRLKATER